MNTWRDTPLPNLPEKYRWIDWAGDLAIVKENHRSVHLAILYDAKWEVWINRGMAGVPSQSTFHDTSEEAVAVATALCLLGELDD